MTIETVDTSIYTSKLFINEMRYENYDFLE